MKQGERIGDGARRHHLVDGDPVAVLGVLVERAVVVRLDGDPGKLLARQPVIVHVALRPHAVERGHHHAVSDLEILALEGQRAAAELRQLLDADDQGHVVEAARHRDPGLAKRAGGRGAGILDIDDRKTRQADRLQNPLPGHHPAKRGSAPGGLDVRLGDPRIVDRLLYGGPGYLGQRLVGLLAEPDHTGADYGDVTHRRSPVLWGGRRSSKRLRHRRRCRVPRWSARPPSPSTVVLPARPPRG